MISVYIYTPVLKGPRVCNTAKHLDDQGALQTGQEKVVEKYRSGLGYKKNLKLNGAPLNPLIKNGKNMAPQ